MPRDRLLIVNKDNANPYRLEEKQTYAQGEQKLHLNDLTYYITPDDELSDSDSYDTDDETEANEATEALIARIESEQPGGTIPDGQQLFIFMDGDEASEHAYLAQEQPQAGLHFEIVRTIDITSPPTDSPATPSSLVVGSIFGSTATLSIAHQDNDDEPTAAPSTPSPTGNQ